MKKILNIKLMLLIIAFAVISVFALTLTACDPNPCDDCENYPCDCIVVCDDCDEYPCECPALTFTVVFIVNADGIDAPQNMTPNVNEGFVLPAIARPGYTLAWQIQGTAYQFNANTTLAFSAHNTAANGTLTLVAVFSGSDERTPQEIARDEEVARIDALIEALENYTGYDELSAAIAQIREYIAEWTGLPVGFRVNVSLLNHNYGRVQAMRRDAFVEEMNAKIAVLYLVPNNLEALIEALDPIYIALNEWNRGTGLTLVGTDLNLAEFHVHMRRMDLMITQRDLDGFVDDVDALISELYTHIHFFHLRLALDEIDYIIAQIYSIENHVGITRSRNFDESTLAHQRSRVSAFPVDVVAMTDRAIEIIVDIIELGINLPFENIDPQDDYIKITIPQGPSTNLQHIWGEVIGNVVIIVHRNLAYAVDVYENCTYNATYASRITPVQNRINAARDDIDYAETIDEFNAATTRLHAAQNELAALVATAIYQNITIQANRFSRWFYSTLAEHGAPGRVLAPNNAILPEFLTLRNNITTEMHRHLQRPVSDRPSDFSYRQDAVIRNTRQDATRLLVEFSNN